jgi:hypothetical protein
MTLTYVALIRGAGGGSEVSAAVLRDILWAHVRAGDPIEHISVRAGPGSRLEIGVFTVPADGRAPDTIAGELVGRVLRHSPSLRRWTLADIRPGSLSSIPSTNGQSQSVPQEFTGVTRKMNMRKRLAGALMAAPLLLGSVAVTTAVTSTPAFADATCTGGVSVYGTLSDGRLTYSVLDPDNGNLEQVVTSTATLGFTPKTLATLNFNTLLVTSTAGYLYRVDIVTNNNSLTFNTPLRIDGGNGGWTHDLLTYDGHGHLYGVADGVLLQYVVSGVKPSPAQVGMRKQLGTGFTVKTLTAVGDDKIAATTSAGELLNYRIDSSGGYSRVELLSSGWSAFSHLLSPGGGLYFGKMPDGSMYWYEDQNPNNNTGGDITYHLDDPVSSRGWTQTLLSAQPETCTYKAPESNLGGRIAAAAIGELGTTEADCDKYGAGCGDIAWCAMFAKWVWRQGGVTASLPSTNFARGLGDWGVDRGLFKSRSGSGNGNPKVGDWVIYGSPVNAGGGHVQIITQVHSNGRITIVGGNQSNRVTTYTINPATARSGADNLPISGYVSPPA